MQRDSGAWHKAAMAQLDNPPLERLGNALLWFMGMAGLAVAAMLPAMSVRGPGELPAWFLPAALMVVGAHGVALGVWLMILALRTVSGGKVIRYQRWFYVAKYGYLAFQSVLILALAAIAAFGFAGESIVFAAISTAVLAIAGALSMRGWHPNALWNYRDRMRGYSAASTLGMAMLLYGILAVAFAWAGSGNIVEKVFGLLVQLAFAVLGVYASRAVGAYGALALIHAGVIGND